MLRRIFNGMLIASLFVGLGMGVTSCKDDDDSSKTEEEQREEAQEKASAFWDVMAQLVSIDDVTDDYEGKTFEPTYGMEDESDPQTRIVNTNDMQTAAQRFANLVQADDIDENTPSYTWTNDEIGTMTYTRVGTPNEWATVDVDIKALPHLKKIIYRVGGEGENGDFGGKAYYRFGDVIKRTVPVAFDAKKNNDNRGTVDEYWICVRPSFSIEGKGDSHWVCVNTVTDKNYEYYKSKTTQADYWLPYSLGYDKENMQNFAELLWAICYPEQWIKNANDYHTDGRLWGFSGLPIFADFKKANLKYHNEHFWKNVQNGWDRAEIAQKALNMYNLGALMDLLPQDGVHLLYKGYKWKWTFSWDCELFEAIFTNGTKNEEKNMHHLEFKDWKEDMKEVKLDVREMGQKFANYGAYFRNDRKHRWVIRHATGKELAANGKYDPKQPINGVEEVYRYYRDVVTTTDLWGDPEETPKTGTTAKNAQEGFGTYMLGDVVEDGEGSRWICIAGAPKSKVYEKNPDNRATFISFDNIKVQGNVATNIINEEEMIDVATKLSSLFNTLQTLNRGDELAFSIDKLGLIGNHILTYSGVDLRKLLILKDSVWHIKNNRTNHEYDSQSENILFNLAYNDGTNNRQPIARIITDATQAGTKRNECITKSGRNIQHWAYRFYKHYEVYDPSKMEALTEDEASVLMTLWHKPWAISTDKMYLDDVAKQDMVNKYASADKWVRLNQIGPNGYNIIGAPRQQAEITATPQDYIWKNGAPATNKTTIFNEPLLFVRVMYVEDNGGQVPNLTSTNGRQLRVVHLLDSSQAYMLLLQSKWALDLYNNCQGESVMWIDNQRKNVVPNWPAP